MHVARQVAQQPVVQVFQVVEALAEIGIAGLAQARAVLGAHPFNRRLGGQARAHRLLQRAVPAPVVGEQAVGLQHLIRGADQAVLAFQHLVDLGLQRLDGVGQPRFLSQGVVGQQGLGGDRLLVQHRHAIGQPLGEARALQALGLVGGQLDVLKLVGAQKLAGADHLGQHHGDDLEVLDLLFVIVTLGAVLDDQHADGPPAAQQRHGQEGVVGVFAGFRAVRERRVAGGVRQVQRPPQAHGLADQALARLQAGDVDSLAGQTLGGEEFEIPGRAAQIDRADLGHHRDGDGAHHHVQLALGGTRAGHGLADLPKQTAWSSNGDAGCRHDACTRSLSLRTFLAQRRTPGVKTALTSKVGLQQISPGDQSRSSTERRLGARSRKSAVRRGTGRRSLAHWLRDQNASGDGLEPRVSKRNRFDAITRL